jgi:hypothetical protein
MKARGRVLLVAAASLLLLAAAPVFAVSTGLVHLPSADIQAQGPTASDNGAQDQVGPDETDGPNSNVQDGAQGQVGPDETDGPNSNVQDGAQGQDGTDQQDSPAAGG